ncbi:uncharacterized protein LOC103510691 [Diaphorina citri]|uniref:protein-L-isoaspartate(D-aspartate) O-methyltransferase n=1 Tax=Diaphorina citri TaxID=121845 RepID=A0A1S4EDD5_DIACI|nr:uncharacterized protein LOC103510691 [Diaphorina citri]
MAAEIRFIVKDGSKGHAEEGPYDIIHLGAACIEVPKEILAQLKPGGRLVFHKGLHNGHYQSLAYIDRLPNGTYLREKSGYPIDKPLGGLISLKEQMDEYKVQLQGKYTKRYRIDKPEDNIWHALGLNRKAETIDAFSISPVMPPNYTGYTHKLRDKFDSAFLREGYERSDFIPHPK